LISVQYRKSSTEQTLDEIGVVKYDMLSISILKVMKDTLKMIKDSGEKLYLIEELGVEKIVSETYLNSIQEQF